MKNFVALIIVLSFFQTTVSFGCGGCAKAKSASMASNIQSTLATSTNKLSGGRIIGGVGQAKAFKNDKVFESVGKDQGEIDPNWKSSISE